MKRLLAFALMLASLAAFGESPIRPSSQAIILNYMDSEYPMAMAAGTWIVQNATTLDQREGAPVNTVRIECHKNLNICIESIARIDRAALDLEETTFDVTKWSKAEITAETKGMCLTRTLTLNFVTKEIYAIRRNGGLSRDGCKTMRSLKPLTQPEVEKLVSWEDAVDSDPRLHKLYK
jgi:hypothetical protein